MLALLAAFIFVLAAFGVKFAAVALVPLGLAVLAVHFVVPVATPWGNRQ